MPRITFEESFNALKRERRELRDEVSQLRDEASKLKMENARLKEALYHAMTIKPFAMIAISTGGIIVTYAILSGRASENWAAVADGVLVFGICTMLGASARWWRRHRIPTPSRPDNISPEVAPAFNSD
jgi:hypothetical protein